MPGRRRTQTQTRIDLESVAAGGTTPEAEAQALADKLAPYIDDAITTLGKAAATDVDAAKKLIEFQIALARDAKAAGGVDHLAAIAKIRSGN